jgi:predicted CxxxxCH...CXXCH cytochrome family protein
VTFAGGAADGSDVTVDGRWCVRCHGDAAREPLGTDAPGIAFAPPADAHGAATGDKVGAHLAHLRGTAGAPALRAAGVDCANCHVIPATAAAHTTVPRVQFRGLAATVWPGKPAVPAPQYTGSTCSNTYCHGAFPGGLARSVTWTGSSADAGCGSCHGFPPQLKSNGTTPHSTSTLCGDCHDGYGAGTVNKATHLDGKVDLSSDCSGCHGTHGRANGGMPGVAYDAHQAAAPPVDTHGAATGVLVGAHLAHVNPDATGIYKPIACTECHPDNAAANHSNGAVDVTFAAATGADLASYSPSFTQGNGTSTATTCNTYCHRGAAGGSVATWSWTGAAATCGSCHGNPPTVLSDGVTPHPGSAACGSCHPGYGAGTVNRATHIDGIVQVSLSCSSCHGDANRVNGDMPFVTYDPNQEAAPPVDTRGASTGVLVGSHLSHVNPTRAGVYKPIACTECHPDDTTGAHPGGGLTVTFAAATGADLAGFTPSFTQGDGVGTATTCSTYCHRGAAGGSVATWSWNGPAAGCGSCHGDPPTVLSDGVTPHSSRTACGNCHSGYTDLTVNPATHIDGTVQAAVDCSSCHGTPSRPNGGMAGATYDPNQASAPPVDTRGSATGVLVGTHLAHVNPDDTGVYKPIACTECHPDNTTGTHPGGGLTVTFAAATGADLAGFTPTRTQGNGTTTATTCSTYCHGASFGGGSVATWSWTGAAATCGSCHGNPPAFQSNGTTPHTSSTGCGGCHQGYTNASVNRATHIDGVIQVSGCTGCHGTANRPNGGIAGVTYDPNQASAPPVETALHSTSTVLVGAHLAHVNPTPSTAGATQPTGGVYRPIACTECHPDNTTGAHPNNAQAQVTFVAATGADLASFVPLFTQGNGTSTPTSCSTYCHNGAGSASATRPTWTGAGATCASCHGFPPATNHTAVASSATACNGCHAGTVKADGTIDVAGGLHINGITDGGGEPTTAGSDCGTCHSAIFNAMNGTVTKATRHSLASASPAFQTTITWAAPLSGIVAANRSCTNMCHADHPHDAGGAVTTHEYDVYADANARATAASTTTRAKTDFTGTATNGGLCVSCHRFGLTAGGPTIDKVAYDASAHDFTAASGSTWQYALHSGSFDRNCTKCHASNAEGRTPTSPATGSGNVSVHYSDNNASLLAGTIFVTSSVTDLVCYNCHGSTATPAAGAQGNRSGKNIQSQFAKANAHITTGGGCLDCHDAHRAKAGTHATPGNLAGPPIEGAAGARLATNPAFWTAPAVGAFTAKAIAAGTDVEATLCFKCHSAFGGTLPAGTTDLAKEFNPANTGSFAGTWASGETAGGFHPVLATSGSNLGAVKLTNLVTTNQAWSTTTRNTMTCTDCHESNNAADPNGPHGSTASFILKGPNTTWSASVVLGSSIPAGTFCLNCHQSTFTNSRFTGHSRSDHFIPCFNCHAAVPHGGPRPGMLINAVGTGGSCVPAGGVIAGWDTTAPYDQSTATNQLCIKSYPSTNASGWSQGNCGCNGSGH